MAQNINLIKTSTNLKDLDQVQKYSNTDVKVYD